MTARTRRTIIVVWAAIALTNIALELAKEFDKPDEATR